MFQSIVEAVFHFSNVKPDYLALADDKKEVTYYEYKELIKMYSGRLKELEVKKGCAVVIEAEQSVDYLALQLAVQLIGGVFIPLEHNCSPNKIREIALLTKASIVITNQDIQDLENVYTYSFFEPNDAVSENDDFDFPCKESISEILFSTGTTGKEKGIVLTHKNNIALAENVINGVEMEKDNVELIPSPLNHSHGLRRYYANMVNGSTVIILGSIMNMKRFFNCLDTYKVNSMDVVPAAMSVILKLTKDKLNIYKDQIRYIQLGAAPMSDDDKQKLISLLPHTRMYNFYGSTESGCTFIYDFNKGNSKKNCIGKPTFNTSAVLIDSDNNEKPLMTDNEGLLATSGNMNMKEYYKDPEETMAAMDETFVYSNDIAYVDADGDVILLGRKGDVINIGGKKVSPDEIETAAKRLGSIADCGCIPIDDLSRGQVPCLFVEMKKGCNFDAVEIRSFLLSELEPFKVPAFIKKIEKIPRSFNGKLLRKELRVIVENEMG